MTAPRSLFAPFQHIWSQDPALDRGHAAFDFEQYMDTGDVQHLPLLPGASPAVFTCKALSRTQMQRVRDKGMTGNLSEGLTEAVAFGVKGWTDFAGASGTHPAPKFKQTPHGEVLATESLDEIYDLNLIAELGSRIMGASTLTPRKGQASR
jgi:hypothetical protein